MAIQQLALLDLQFRGKDDQEKSRRLAEEVRRTQQTLNRVIADINSSLVTRAAGSGSGELRVGEWDVTIVPGSPPIFRIRYNDGGTLRTGSITLS